jgi:hypothetical protein
MSRRPPQPTTAELKRWGRLASCAVIFADRPDLDTGDLAEAARLARKVPVPGVLSHDNPFVKLQKAAALYAEGTAAQRRELAGELSARAGECRALLNAIGEAKAAPAATPPPDPPARFRADIDG